ncbi:hypothetical protein NDU88_000339 [Pleurodeles waltl]|uniref:Uncharacterized protein n=1 Tax=Pleurodeles waltl TaxID=8319 RepID=A0AAV7V5E6_PLEWA|nr:hypothetical protein NDU88_000339 [Pleurodeles waltl]
METEEGQARGAYSGPPSWIGRKCPGWGADPRLLPIRAESCFRDVPLSRIGYASFFSGIQSPFDVVLVRLRVTGAFPLYSLRLRAQRSVSSIGNIRAVDASHERTRKLRWRQGPQRPAGPEVRGWSADAAALNAVSGARALVLRPETWTLAGLWCGRQKKTRGGPDPAVQTRGGPGRRGDRLGREEDSPARLDRIGEDQNGGRGCGASPGPEGGARPLTWPLWALHLGTRTPEGREEAVERTAKERLPKTRTPLCRYAEVREEERRLGWGEDPSTRGEPRSTVRGVRVPGHCLCALGVRWGPPADPLVPGIGPGRRIDTGIEGLGPPFPPRKKDRAPAQL